MSKNQAIIDARTSSILINLNLCTNPITVANKYVESVTGIEQAENSNKKKVYSSLRQTLRECYFVGSLRYGNNFFY